LDSNLDSLMAFFEKFGSTDLVQMRKNKKKEFKVTLFAVMSKFLCVCTAEAAEAIGLGWPRPVPPTFFLLGHPYA